MRTRRLPRQRAAAVAWSLTSLAALSVALWGCRGGQGSDLPGPSPLPGVAWQVPLAEPHFGPYPLSLGDTLGSVWGDGDSLRWLRTADGVCLAAWAWPPGFAERSWGLENVAVGPRGLVLLGAQQAAFLRPGADLELWPYPPGGASFRLGHYADDGSIYLSWQRDSGAVGPEALQILHGVHGQWTAVASVPARQGLFDAPRTWKRGWAAVLRRGTHSELWWTDRGILRSAPLCGGDGTGHPPSVSGTDLYYASQDSALAFDLHRGRRKWARALPDGLDVGVHGFVAASRTWNLLSSRGWWLTLDGTTGDVRNQGQIPPLWLDRWSAAPWTFIYSNMLYIWNIDKPNPVDLPMESQGYRALSQGPWVLFRAGGAATAWVP
ncbi:MAG: hypothetical protein RIR07_672 [Bacteroidota bacterium]